MKRPCLLFAAVALLLVGTGEASADYISGVTATTDMGAGFGTDIQTTVNGNGLSSPSLTATHDATSPFNSWVSSQGSLTGTITFNLGGLYNVSGFSFWNQNNGGPGPFGITGISNVQVLYSGDGTHFSSLPGGPSVFAQVMTDDGSPPQMFSFPSVKASAFQFNVLGNYGDPSESGFAEVAFNGTAAATPVPPSFTLCVSAFAMLAGFAGWRRCKLAVA